MNEINVSKKWMDEVNELLLQKVIVDNIIVEVLPIIFPDNLKRNSFDVLPTDTGYLWPAFSIRCSAALLQEFTVTYGYLLQGSWIR